MSNLTPIADKSPQEAYDFLVHTIAEARLNIGQSFMTLGQALTYVKKEKLYQQGGFTSFAAFLQDRRVDIDSRDADRFMAMTRDPAFERNLNMGLSKMLELMKLPAAQREHLLQTGAEVNGQHKNIEDMNLKEMKMAAQGLKREGKSRCDRCRRWVEEVKELNGRQYGAGAGHNCYELEIEERQALSAGRIPEAQVDQVLQTLRSETSPSASSEQALQWLPESLYQLYGQLLVDQEQAGGEVSRENLEHEAEVLRKLNHLCQTRLQDIQETLKALDELEA